MPEYSLVANPGHQGVRIAAAISFLKSAKVGILIRQAIQKDALPIHTPVYDVIAKGSLEYSR